TEKRTRDKAVKNLAIFLSNDATTLISDIEMARLWKGIFYCFWMSDKPLVQQALAQELAELVLTITDVPSSLNFLKGFWTTTVREWNGIDRLRMDKFYMLVRRFVNASFRLLIRTDWDGSALQGYHFILTNPGGPLCPSDMKIPSSLAFHVAEVYLEELDKALASSEPSTPVPLIALLLPFVTLSAHTPTSATYKHLQDVFFWPLLEALKPTQTPNPTKKARVFPNIMSNACIAPPDGVTAAGAIRKAILQMIFDIASAEDTRDVNRRKLYALYRVATEDDEDNDE
ncbi:nucleolar protein,Nop52-domain-containing protein, partial [Phlebopus sp. FC_14]